MNHYKLILVGLLLSFATQLMAEEWKITGRSLAPPAAASQVVRNAIAAAPQPDVARARAQAPATEAEWRTVVAQRDAQMPFDLVSLGEQLNVTIERDTLSGVAIYRVTPAVIPPENRGRLFLYLHGGAYVFNGGDAAVGESALISARAGMPVVAVDYRMPPEFPSPAAVDDVEAVYRMLVKTHAPGAIGMGGTSAGGGLTLASVHRFKARDLPVPGALYLGTPWADLTDTSDSLHTLEGVDRLLVSYYGVLQAAAHLYANGRDLKHPELSPLYGDFTGFPPTYLVTGTRDMFLSDTARTHRKLRTAGIPAELNVYEGLSHAEYAIMVGAPEFDQVYTELAEFLARHLK